MKIEINPNKLPTPQYYTDKIICDDTVRLSVCIGTKHNATHSELLSLIIALQNNIKIARNMIKDINKIYGKNSPQVTMYKLTVKHNTKLLKELRHEKEIMSAGI